MDGVLNMTDLISQDSQNYLSSLDADLAADIAQAAELWEGKLHRWSYRFADPVSEL